MVVWMSDGERHLRTSSIGHPFSGVDYIMLWQFFIPMRRRRRRFMNCQRE